MTALFSLRGLTRRFAAREVLHIDHLDIEAGKIYGLLGPNGAGKTTLMKILAFMDTPSSGELLFRGKEVRPVQAALHRAEVVWVPQSPVMFTGTLLYNVEYPMRLQGVAAKLRRVRAMELLETVNLAPLALAPAHRLSGGEAQRGSIARALAAGAQVILFDEPTASVDHRSRSEVIRLIRELWSQRGLSLLVTTHDAHLAAELCQERIMLRDGKIVPQYLLPDGQTAWPAHIRQTETGHCLLLPPEAEADLIAAPLTVRGIAEIAAGLTLRLASPQGDPLETLLNDPESIAFARTLTLGRTVRAEIALPAGKTHA